MMFFRIKRGEIIKRRVFGDAPVYLLTAALQSISPLILLPMQRVSLGLDSLGMVILASTVSGFTGLLATMGVADSVLRRRLAGDVHVSEAMRIVRTIPFAAIPTSILVAVCLGFSGLNTSMSSQWAIIVGALSGISICTLLVCQQSVRADGRPWSYLLNIVVWQFISPLVGLGLVLFGFGIKGYLLGWGGALVLGACWAVQSSIFPHRPLPKAENSLFNSYRDSIALGFPILLHSLAGAAVLLVDRSVLASSHGGKDVAIYQAIFLLGQATGMVLSAFNNSWAVRIFKSKVEERWRGQRIEIGVLAFAVLGLVGGLMIVVQVVFRFMMGSQVDPRWPTIIIVCMASLGMTQILYLGGMNALYLTGKTRDLAKITLPCALAQSLLSVVLIQPLGYLGPCIAIIVVQSLQSILVWCHARRGSQVEPISGYWWFSAILLWLVLIFTAGLNSSLYPVSGALLVVFSLLGVGRIVRRRDRALI
ncbi:lipopolysaccharide biosynthesis protein [Arthrobacter sp. STN4]|uniref:lipopolysaccharide biosynthesis protein n=1 Tax=Arthrobacter sp. STN4 TaxID=2923276 RepID=UPI002119DDCD|nr:lipopolysaccharide biosynthesis protein [Arthrobacter sp. STN4]MCQ9163667.1 lipopolysaccharide biosynthesis protein [Arthrobacter sp. STN4]